MSLPSVRITAASTPLSDDSPAAARVATTTLAAELFDGRSARAWPVRLWLEHEQLVVHGAAGERRHAVRRVVWPEPMRHGQRQVHLPDGGVLVVRDAQAWDDWVATGHGQGLPRRGLVAAWIGNWPQVLLALIGLVAMLFAALRLWER